MDWLNMGANIEIFLFARPNFQKKLLPALLSWLSCASSRYEPPAQQHNGSPRQQQLSLAAAALSLSSNSH